MPVPRTIPSPPLGTFIDSGRLQLVEVLGMGGYGVVYRAVPVSPQNSNVSFAVKCLIHQPTQTARQRHLVMKEIALHKLASAHPHVVSLHRVLSPSSSTSSASTSSSPYTYLVMDYAPDGDLFTQILHERRFLGNDALIKHAFLQILDAVEYCHSLGVYHRDLKPENVLCWDKGLRVALTDFGLATTEKISTELKTGSVYHMSPECCGGSFAPSNSYSPRANDIWSLAIILLNLATGRNPWKTACTSDATFSAYLSSPHNFLPSVLPISDEMNELLVRMLEVDWRRRIGLEEIRQGIIGLKAVYARSAVFEGSMARCAWEAEMDYEDSRTEDSAAATQASASAPQTDNTDSYSSSEQPSESPLVFARMASSSAFTATDSLADSWVEEEDGLSRSPTPPGTFDMLSPASSTMPTTPGGLDTDMRFHGDEIQVESRDGGCSPASTKWSECDSYPFPSSPVSGKDTVSSWATYGDELESPVPRWAPNPIPASSLGARPVTPSSKKAPITSRFIKLFPRTPSPTPAPAPQHTYTHHVVPASVFSSPTSASDAAFRLPASPPSKPAYRTQKKSWFGAGKLWIGAGAGTPVAAHS